MAQRETLRVQGYREFIRACDHAGKDTRKEVRGTFRKVGDLVRVDATSRFDQYDARTASHFKTIVRQRGVDVEQTLRKVTGLRPDWGALQMVKALLPALAAREDDVEREMEHAIDRVAVHFER